jgi:hypothetical protein
VSTLTIDKITKLPDFTTIDIPVRFGKGDPTDPSPIPLEFFICKQSKVKDAFNTQEHFKDFVSKVNSNHLNGPGSDRLVALAESEEAANQLIDKEIGGILSQFGDSLIDLHITDREIYNK